MPEPLIFSMSQISTYIECKKKAQLAYEMALEPIGNDESAMSRGTAFHKYAEYQTSLLWSHLPRLECPDVTGETVALWKAWWDNRGKQLHDKKRKVFGVEHPLYIPCDVNTGVPGQGVYLRCTFDEIFLDKQDWIVGLDYKTFKTHTAWDVDLDFQGRTYISALQRLFPSYKVRFQYERVRQSAPGTPRGESSNLRCEEGLWWQYNKAGDKRKRADLWTPEDCYETIDLVVSKEETDALWSETLFNIMELLVRRKAALDYPGAWGRTTSKMVCQFCNFKGLCKADLTGTLDDQTIALMATIRKPLEIPEELKEEYVSLPV